MLVYQYNSNILAVFCEAVECSFDGCVLGLVVDNEEVLFGISACRDMLYDGLVSAFFCHN